jgi:hypothetical protein
MIGAHLEQLWVILMAIGVLVPIPFFLKVKAISAAEQAEKGL